MENISFSGSVMEFINFTNICIISSNNNIDKTQGMMFIETRITNVAFYNSHIDDVNFQNAQLKNFEFIDTVIKDCWFKDTKLFSGHFIKSSITYCDFTKALLEYVHFYSIIINNSSFIKAYIVNCSWNLINFTDIDFSFATWSECHMCNSNFINCLPDTHEIKIKTKIINSFWNNQEILNL